MSGVPLLVMSHCKHHESVARLVDFPYGWIEQHHKPLVCTPSS